MAKDIKFNIEARDALSGASVQEIPWGPIMAASVIVTVPLVVSLGAGAFDLGRIAQTVQHHIAAARGDGAGEGQADA